METKVDQALARIERDQAKIDALIKSVEAMLDDPNFQHTQANKIILLQKENAALKLEIASLRRALAIRNSINVTSDNMAVSSSEIDSER
jgi:hypothetical protein